MISRNYPHTVLLALTHKICVPLEMKLKCISKTHPLSHHLNGGAHFRTYVGKNFAAKFPPCFVLLVTNKAGIQQALHPSKDTLTTGDQF